MQNKSQFIFIFEREYLLQRRKIGKKTVTSKFSSSERKEMLAFRLLSREKIRPMGQIFEQRTQ